MFKNYTKENFQVIFFLIFFIFLSVLLYQRLTYTFITAEFKELRPMHEKVNVFYKGYKIGKVLFIKPHDNYKTSLVTIALFPVNLKLPKNVTATMRRDKSGDKRIDYLEIDYPSSPMITFLKTGDKIEGKTTVDLESFLASQDTDSLENMKENLEKTIDDLRNTIQGFGDLSDVLYDMVDENRKNLKATTKSISDTTRNLDNLSDKINNSINEEKLNQTLTNIYATTENIQGMASGINGQTPVITNSISRVDNIIKNTDEITSGVSNTLKKPFGGLRLIFGKTIDTCP